MKNTRRFASVATAALLAACVAVPMTSAFSASAATAGTVTFTKADTKDAATHTYKAYKIFSGTVDETEQHSVGKYCKGCRFPNSFEGRRNHW